MPNIIRQASIGKGRRVTLNFDRVGEPNCGYAFDCDEAGNVKTEGWSEAAHANYAQALTGTDANGTPLIRRGVQIHEWTYRIPAVLRCDCGAEVSLSGFTNTCDRCEADYNHTGSRLAPRSQWGEETGESIADIFSSRDPEAIGGGYDDE